MRNSQVDQNDIIHTLPFPITPRMVGRALSLIAIVAFSLAIEGSTKYYGDPLTTKFLNEQVKQLTEAGTGAFVSGCEGPEPDHKVILIVSLDRKFVYIVFLINHEVTTCRA